MRELVAASAIAAGNRLGEGILWCPLRKALYWTDIEAATLWRHCPATGVTDQWPMPERLASFALCKDIDWLLLGLASRLAFLHLPTNTVETICSIEADLPTRINDGACDREGRFVFGTKHEPQAGEPLQAISSFYRLDPDLSLHRLELDKVAIANGVAFSPDGRIMYFCDSPTRVIHRCEYTTAGLAQGAHEWVQLAGGDGEPDGAAVDAQGGLWTALWGAARVVHYAPDGCQDAVVHVPARLPSRPALGGDDLDILYISSARDGLTARELLDDRQAGNVFAIRTSTHGLPESRFAGRPLAPLPMPQRQRERNRNLPGGMA